MLVALTFQQRGVSELDADVTWSAAANRAVGELSFTLPRGHRLWSDQYVNEAGGMLVEAWHELLGAWYGIAEAPDIDMVAGTMAIRAQQLDQFLKLRCVSPSRVFRGLTAGAIARAAVQDGLVGVAGLSLLPLSFAECAPFIQEYTFSGQTVAAVFADLLEQTGQEWKIEATGRTSGTAAARGWGNAWGSDPWGGDFVVAGGSFSEPYAGIRWQPPIGALVTTHLVDGADLANVRREGQIQGRLTEVIARDSDGRSYRARAVEATPTAGSAASSAGWGGDLWGTDPWGGTYAQTGYGVNLWQQQEVINVATRSPFALGLAAEARLLASYGTPIRYTAELDPSRWMDVREGDYAMLVLLRDGLYGKSPVCRVLERRYEARSDSLTLSMSLVRPFDALTPAWWGARRAVAAVGQTDPSTQRTVADLTTRVAALEAS